MNNIFVFTAGNKEARGHLQVSIINSLDSSLLKKYLSEEALIELNKKLDINQSFYAWGAVPGVKNIPNWESINIGDTVLCVYDATYHYYATVLGKLRSKALASNIWGLDGEGNTWEYMYVLSKPIKINIPIDSPAVDNYLYKAYKGFTKIASERLDLIIKDFFSQKNFFNAVFFNFASDLEEEVNNVSDVQYAKFSPDNDGKKSFKEKVLRAVSLRRGQPKFRKALLLAYAGKCAITGCTVDDVLEAAHIVPYDGVETNVIQNGLLLRADIHTLFDLGILRVNDQYIVEIDPKLSNSIYQQYSGMAIFLPKKKQDMPSTKALALKYQSSFGTTVKNAA